MRSRASSPALTATATGTSGDQRGRWLAPEPTPLLVANHSGKTRLIARLIPPESVAGCAILTSILLITPYLQSIRGGADASLRPCPRLQLSLFRRAPAEVQIRPKIIQLALRKFGEWKSRMTRIGRDAFAFLSGVFLLCMSVLMIQIVQTRMLSVVSLYYMAFFSISMAMLGLTGGALIV